MTLQFLQTDDWTAVYKDNVLLYENHSVSAEELADLLNLTTASRYIEDQEEWYEIAVGGGAPADWPF